MEKKIKCPYCGKDTIYSPANESRPFCSERCRLLDLGEWADGKYAIPVSNNASPDQEDVVDGDKDSESESQGED